MSAMSTKEKKIVKPRLEEQTTNTNHENICEYTKDDTAATALKENNFEQRQPYRSPSRLLAK